MELQIPHFIYSAPTAAHGGGAEVLPTTTWFANNTCTEYMIHSLSPIYADLSTRLYQVDDQFPPTEGAAPFDFNSTEVSFPVPTPAQKSPDLSLFITPVYSVSGFDLLSILSRVATRPNPRVVLGPVDLTCAFVVVDIRRYDHPIVYCSPSFCTLTGYSEEEVIGKNCRFLQAPSGQVSKGDIRHFTSPDAVTHLAKSLAADKECQTTIVNYKKNGDPFVNLVTVIPLPGGLDGNVDEQEVVFQVGFQVNLREQPNAILEKSKHGSYVIDYANSLTRPTQQQQDQHQQSRPAVSRERKSNHIPPAVISKELKRLLIDPAFLGSLPITTSTIQSPSPVSTTEDPSIPHLLHLLLLEASPDFIHVVSLKGSFLYVAPSVRRVLGYEPDEMVGTCIADYAHPEDVVPLMRELKESSATGLSSAQTAPPLPDPTTSYSAPSSSAPPGSPRSVDLLFRAKTKMGRYVWVECRGRLHVEPGKGRKVIILSGRTREMMNLKWEDVDSAGGLAMTVRVTTEADTELEGSDGGEGGKGRWCYQDQEFWGMLGGMDKDSARFLSVGKGVRDVLGWSGEELLGKGLDEIVEQSNHDVLGEAVAELRKHQKAYYAHCSYDDIVDPRVKKVLCRLATKSGSAVDVWFILYRADPDLRDQIGCTHTTGGKGVLPAPLVYQIRKVDASVVKCGRGIVDALTTSAPLHQDIFQELDISRSSSWQYELQQLRFANIRLKEELKVLEAAEEAAEATATAVAPRELTSEREQERFGEYAGYQEQQSVTMQQSSSIPQHMKQQHYSLPMPPPLPVLAPQPQVPEMQTPDRLLDQQHNLKRQQYFHLLDDSALPMRSSVETLMVGSARIGSNAMACQHPRQQVVQCLPQTRADWRTVPAVPSPPSFPLLLMHRHQHQQQHQRQHQRQHHYQHEHQHQHYDNQSLSDSQGQGQRYGFKRSWNTMETA